MHTPQLTQEIVKDIQNNLDKADALLSLASALAYAEDIRAYGIFQQTKVVAHNIHSIWEQPNVLSELAVTFANAEYFQQSLSVLGMCESEEFIKILARWQSPLADYKKAKPQIWQEMVLAALEIICWVRKDYEPVRDIFRASVAD